MDNFIDIRNKWLSIDMFYFRKHGKNLMTKKTLTLLAIALLVFSLFFGLLHLFYSDNTNQEPLSAFYLDTNGAASHHTLHLIIMLLIMEIQAYVFAEDYSSRDTREVYGTWIDVKPNDHIVMSCWVKTEDFSSSDMQAGAVFGWDFYADTSQGYGIICYTSDLQAGHPNGTERGWGIDSFGYTQFGKTGLICRVPWGQHWMLISWDFYVPKDYFSYVLIDGVRQCNPVQINSMVPWFEGRNIYDAGNIWFSEPQLHLNPSGHHLLYLNMSSPYRPPDSTLTPTASTFPLLSSDLYFTK